MPYKPHLCDRIDSSVIPDDYEKHHPPTVPPSTEASRAPTPQAGTYAAAAPLDDVPDDRANTPSSRTVHNEDSGTTDLELGVTAEGELKRRKTLGPSKELPAETRDWPDDIVTFDSKTDSANPRNWPFWRKVAITMLVGVTTLCSTFASSVFSSASPYIAKEFGISIEVSTLGIAIFVAGYVPGPVIWAPISELHGRRIAIIIPMFVFICLSAATATAKDLQTIYITRFFAGVMASAPVTIAGGAIADMFDQKERGAAVVFYALAVVSGPCVGPVIGAAVSESHLGWRWTEYLTVILTSVILTADVIYLPETFAPVLLTRKARHLRLKTGRWALHSRQETVEYTISSFLEGNFLRPIRMILFEPMVTALTMYTSFVYGILYLLFSVVPIVYEEHRGWKPLPAALPFLSVLVGTMLAALINIIYSTRVFVPLIEKHGVVAPEKRLPPMILGAIAFPVGFFLLGWTASPSIHWFPSVLGLTFVGMSFLLIFQSGINYLIDAYTQYAASAVAANTFLRSMFAAGLPFVARPMFDRLGVPWGCTLLGLIGVALAGVPILFHFYGAKLRARSSMAISDEKND